MNQDILKPEPTCPQFHIRDILFTYLGAMLLTALLTFLFTRPDLHPVIFRTILLGWGLALIGALLGSGIKFIALRGDFGWFMIWALGINGTRASLFIAIIVAVILSTHPGQVMTICILHGLTERPMESLASPGMTARWHTRVMQ